MNSATRVLGTPLRFLLPSLKLMQPDPDGRTLESRLHTRIMENFGGYTVAAGNIFGYWRNEGRDIYGEHREYRVAVAGDEGRARVEHFLAELAEEMEEEEIYVEAGGEAYVVMARK